MALRWSDGTTCERSPRKIIQKVEINNLIGLEVIKENSAYLQSLDESPCWLDTNYVHQHSNKREDTLNKMSEREMVGQIGRNPFLASNYVEDVINSNMFLKPIATNFDKIESHKENKELVRECN